jgi:hypothetical protein
MRKPAAFFPIVLALGAIILAPQTGAQAQDAQEGPTEIEKCRTISQPGSYKLVNNLVAGTGDCLVITAGFVTIDLAGFTITGTAGQNTGIAARPSTTGGAIRALAVRNGSISGFGAGVDLDSAEGSIVEGLRVFGDGLASHDGIIASGIVKGNTVLSIFGTGMSATGTVTGNYVAFSRFTQIEIGQGSTVIGNSAGPGADVGILVSCPSNLTDNTATGNLTNLVLNGEGCHNEDNLAP